MKTEYVSRRKVVRLGRPIGTLVVSLPKVWAEAHGVAAGQEVIVAYDGYRYLKVIPLQRAPEEKGKGGVRLKPPAYLKSK